MSRAVLDIVDVIAIVTDQSLAGMRDTQRLLKLVSCMPGEAKCMVVANRVGGTPGEVGRADFERGIEAKIAVAVPFDLKAAAGAAQLGKPFGDVARAPKTLAELQALTLILGGADAKPAAPRFLSRVLRK